MPRTGAERKFIRAGGLGQAISLGSNKWLKQIATKWLYVLYQYSDNISDLTEAEPRHVATALAWIITSKTSMGAAMNRG